MWQIQSLEVWVHLHVAKNLADNDIGCNRELASKASWETDALRVSGYELLAASQVGPTASDSFEVVFNFLMDSGGVPSSPPFGCV